MTTFNPLAAWSAAELDAAIDGFVADYLAVLAHVIGDEQAYPWCRLMEPLRPMIEHRRLDMVSVPMLKRLTAWTLSTLLVRHDVRTLTPEQRALADAAWRLSDALHGRRTTSEERAAEVARSRKGGP